MTRLQRQLSNGQWVEVEQDRVDEFLVQALAKEKMIAERQERPSLQTTDELLEKMAAGERFRYDEDWYANLRDGDAWITVDRPAYSGRITRCVRCGQTTADGVFFTIHANGTICDDCLS